METKSRRSFIKQASAVAVGMPLVAATVATEDELLLYEVKVLQQMASETYKSLWTNLKGITEKEADWRPNKESNSVRWVVGHLCWFEEYVGDTLENKGRYLTDKKPQSIQEPSFEKLKERFDAARANSIRLIGELTAESLRREITYVGRLQVTIESLLRTHTLHLSGHRYQVRYIRGTYSRVFHTNKADFDPW